MRSATVECCIPLRCSVPSTLTVGAVRSPAPARACVGSDEWNWPRRCSRRPRWPVLHVRRRRSCVPRSRAAGPPWLPSRHLAESLIRSALLEVRSDEDLRVDIGANDPIKHWASHFLIRAIGVRTRHRARRLRTALDVFLATLPAGQRYDPVNATQIGLTRLLIWSQAKHETRRGKTAACAPPLRGEDAVATVSSGRPPGGRCAGRTGSRRLQLRRRADAKITSVGTLFTGSRLVDNQRQQRKE